MRSLLSSTLRLRSASTPAGLNHQPLAACSLLQASTSSSDSTLLDFPPGLQANSSSSSFVHWAGSATPRAQAIAKLVASERAYTKALENLINYYMEPLKSVLSELELFSIFSVVDVIADFHRVTLSELEKLLRSKRETIGAFLLERVSFFRSYSAYVNNYTIAVGCLSACLDRPEVTERLAALCGAVTADGEQLQSLYSYLAMPIQRMPRYLYLLSQLKEHTPSADADYAALQKTIYMLSQTLEYISAKRQTYEATLRMIGLSVAILHLPPGIAVVQPKRTFKAEGDFHLVNSDGTEKPVTVFLFSNAVFFTEVLKNTSRIKFKAPPVRRSSSSSDHLDSASPQPLDRFFSFVNSIDLNDSKTVLVRRFTDGLYSIAAAERQFLLRPDATGEQQPPSVIAGVCTLLGIPLPDLQSRETASSSSSEPIVRRRRTSIFGSLLPSESLSASDSKTSKLRARSCSPDEAPAIANRCFSCEAKDSDQEGQLAFNPLDHLTLVRACFTPERAPSFSDVLPCWGDIEADENSLEQFVSFVPGYHIELGNRRLRGELIVPPSFMFSDFEVPFYERHMAHLDHLNFFSDSPGRGPVIISAEVDAAPHSLGFRRVVIRSKLGERRTTVPASRGPPTRRGFFKHLERCNPDVLAKGTVWTASSPSSVVEAHRSASPRSVGRSLAALLIDYDACQRRMLTKLKIGVLNTQPGDMASRSDRAIYDHQTISPDFQEFLDFLGQRVQLSGYTGFAGGLDTASDLTGTHSVTASFAAAQEVIEIMFHVSALLPHRLHESQQLAKKRHVGNDIVVVVFHEDTEPFDPSVLRSKMNQVFLVVRKVGSNREDSRPRYQLAFFCKEQAPCLPLLPNIPDFVADDNFRRFLLAKIINAEATTHHTSPIFSQRNCRARTGALQEIGGLFW